MSQHVRFVVRIDSDWNVSIECEQDPGWRPESTSAGAPKALTRLPDPEGGNFPSPSLALHAPDTPHDELGPPPAVAEIRGLYDEILARKGGERIVVFGHYLFDVLLGPDVWAELEQKAELLGAGNLELALCWAETDRDLHRLNWELMRSDDAFLAAGTSKLDVAITRLVDSTAVGELPQLEMPPRVLFVVGTSLAEEEIRPGAELHGLLRQSREGRAMRYRVLERASPQVLKEAVQSFGPDIVHFVCHGGVDDQGRVYLILQTDESDADPRRYAGQLLVDLQFGLPRRLPTMVVLSACMTAGGAMSGPTVIAGGHETAPMATALVDGGVPIVLGMAGRVADITCRLFAKRFGTAVIKGQPLAQATAEARRVAFAEGRDPLISPDWAFPALFLARAVPAGYAPIGRKESEGTWQAIEGWIGQYGLPSTPVFCGREELMRKCHALFEPANDEEGHKWALAAFVDTQERGYGRTRFLQELAAQALRDGHIPVLLTFDKDKDDFPKDIPAFAIAFERAIRFVRGVLTLEDPLNGFQLDLALGDPSASELDSGIKAELRLGRGQVTPRAASLAIRSDLATLLADARASIPFFESAGGKVIVLLDDVDRYEPLVDMIFAERPNDGFLDGNGLGSPGQPIPVVMTCSIGGGNDAAVKLISEQRKIIPWLETAQLKRFEENGEDMLAYELVLLNPFVPLSHPVADRPWAFNDDIDPEVRARWEDRYRRRLKGIPVNLGNEVFYNLAEDGRDDNFTIEADDDVWLARIARSQ